MNTTDLMIGDWVYNHRKWACPTVEIHKDSAVVIARHYGEEEFKLSDLHPIPLTPEILEKNGFKEITGKVKKLIWAWKGLEKLVEISEVTPCVYQVIVHKDASDLGDERVFVKYVHELQHALKLCGIEKEITI